MTSHAIPAAISITRSDSVLATFSVSVAEVRTYAAFSAKSSATATLSRRAAAAASSSSCVASNAFRSWTLALSNTPST